MSQTYRRGYTDEVLPGVANGAISPPDWKPRVDDCITHSLSAPKTGLRPACPPRGFKERGRATFLEMRHQALRSRGPLRRPLCFQ